MPYKPLFGSKHREAIWCREATNAYIAGRGHFPICNICYQPVHPQEDWDISHGAVPKALSGKSVGVGHRDCNREHGSKVVVPFVAKTKRMREKDNGERGPGRGRHPLRAGRRSRESKTFRIGLQPRLNGAQKHELTMAKLAIVPAVSAPELDQ